MIKILPLLILPIFFLIFLINVNFLTPNLFKDSKEISDDNVYKIEKENEKFKDIGLNIHDDQNKIHDDKLKEIESFGDSSNSPDLQKKVDKLTNEGVNEIEEIKETSNKKLSEYQTKQTSKKNNSQVKVKPKPKPDNLIITKKTVKLQFGAFSKIKNADLQKEKINKIITSEFPEVSNKLKIVEENRLFKLILFSENNSIAKSICEFSKSKKMSCIILKK